MKNVPMTLIVHTNLIKASDYGEISVLGETLEKPLMRCKVCNIQPEFSYSTRSGEYHIEHVCNIMNSRHRFTAYSYKDLCEQWNRERGKNYGSE